MFRDIRRALTTSVLVLTASVLLPTSAEAQADKKIDVTGKWTFTVTTDAGSGTPTVTLKQQGDSLTGHYSSQIFGEVPFSGTVKDGKIRFGFESSVQGTKVHVTYWGTVDSADAMKGTVDFGGMGGGTFTAKRQ
jgi:hypothetical protein